MSKHTPGPWTAREPNGPGMGWRVGPAWLGEKPWSDETSANARLIAAAPDLLAALEAATAEIRAIYGDQPPATNSVVMLIEAAIAKAKGQP